MCSDLKLVNGKLVSIADGQTDKRISILMPYTYIVATIPGIKMLGYKSCHYNFIKIVLDVVFFVISLWKVTWPRLSVLLCFRSK